MVGISCSKFILVLPVLLAVLLHCPCAVVCLLEQGDDHSVYYDFNISSKKQPWCMTQVQMDGKYSFSYDCGKDKVISINLLREEVMATETWKEQTKMLRDVGNLIRQHLHDIEPENHTGPFTLQARMTCQRDASGNYNGSWAFGWNGQRVLHFDSKSGKYTVDHSGGEQMKEKVEILKKLTQELKNTLKGDCKKWLPHLVLWKKELETTGAPFTAPATATPSTVSGAAIMAPATATPSTVSAAPAKTAATTIASIVFGALGVLIFGFIGLGWFH